MKHLLTLTFLLTYFYASATIIQVNNNAGADADYTMLQDAIDDATVGDTLYISGSPNNYDESSSTIKLNKKLTLIGPGYFLGENLGYASNLTAKVNDIIIGAGASGSIIMGLDFSEYNNYSRIDNQNYDGSASTAPPSNITLKGNTFYSLRIEGSNQIIQGNFFDYTLSIYDELDNSIIKNNIMKNLDGYYVRDIALTNISIRNNVLNSMGDIHGTEIINNIFLGNTAINDCDNGSIKNNIFVSASSTAIPSQNTGNTVQDNLFSQAKSTLFEKSSPSIDSDYQLSLSSSAEGAGFNGVDAGAFGGPTPYVVSGIPPIPTITELTTSGTGTTSGGLKVKIQAKANQ